MTPLVALLDEAIEALARLDAPALERVEERALELRALRVRGAHGDEAAARLRVFASVLRGTDRGLHVMARVRGSVDQFQSSRAAGGLPWAR